MGGSVVVNVQQYDLSHLQNTVAAVPATNNNISFIFHTANDYETDEKSQIKLEINMHHLRGAMQYRQAGHV